MFSIALKSLKSFKPARKTVKTQKMAGSLPSFVADSKNLPAHLPADSFCRGFRNYCASSQATMSTLQSPSI